MQWTFKNVLIRIAVFSLVGLTFSFVVNNHKINYEASLVAITIWSALNISIFLYKTLKATPTR